jgi:hypothetical protein
MINRVKLTECFENILTGRIFFLHITLPSCHILIGMVQDQITALNSFDDNGNYVNFKPLIFIP